jgi:uncharacterized DUF497 family protein
LARFTLERIVDGEERWQVVGMVGDFLLLLVVHTVHNADDIEVIRIISARKVEKHESRLFEYGEH